MYPYRIELNTVSAANLGQDIGLGQLAKQVHRGLIIFETNVFVVKTFIMNHFLEEVLGIANSSPNYLRS